MAVDTEDKRRSATGFYPFMVAPVPDGAIGASDRRQITGVYSGITTSVPSVMGSVFGGLVVR